ncbi:cytochrome b/b6 domain-containing protein [Paramicrobacterium chengjingii]|uniref:Cytochrome b/b6 domain-containing protein n=1 Tax=Paramicrobacterium chengjingii TaxID=2769067 RepID=A0ABX6YFV7_9MICO|nr:cytochrome b/b6 domain-containing protein [Microbacterium chengjingii]QPZ37662.1 cytochrome b/b6 domain-containing protein [Microbacterium chengjingii]
MTTRETAGTPGADEKRAHFPRLRVGRRWLNLIWTLPAAVVLLLAIVGIGVALRQLPGVEDFIARHPGTVERADPQGFPWWLRWQHFLNIVFLLPIMRSGLQILAGRPRLFWKLGQRPGDEWLRLNEQVEPGMRVSPRHDAVGLPTQLGLPGVRRTTASARWWHLTVTMLWLLNGIVFYIVLFTTGQWVRVVPTSLDVFPNALSAVLQYASLDFPDQRSWVAYNGIQLLTYFVTVFVAAPLAVITGMLQSPRISKAVGAARSNLFGAEAARSVHAIALGWFIVFTIVHVALVLTTGAAENLNHITLGHEGTGPAGLALFAIGVAVIAVLWAIASPVTNRWPDVVQAVALRMLGPLAKWF